MISLKFYSEMVVKFCPRSFKESSKSFKNHLKDLLKDTKDKKCTKFRLSFHFHYFPFFISKEVKLYYHLFFLYFKISFLQ